MSKTLYRGSMYWPTTLSQFHTYSPLAHDRQTDVVIVGGGMSGCICAYVMANAGIDTILIESEQVAAGSSSANTGLLQFSSDMMLCDLIEQIGVSPAIQLYKGCQQAIEQLKQVVISLGIDVGFYDRSSLYYASTAADVPKLRREFACLQSHGFPVEWWDETQIAAHFPFRRAGAIVTHGDAEINPFRFVHSLVEACQTLGMNIFEHTSVTAHHTDGYGMHHLHTSTGYSIQGKHVIYAIGYEPEQLRGKLVRANLNRSYAIVTDPQPHLDRWHERWLIWETARPYLYLRTTADNRIIIGGLDEPSAEPVDEGRPLHEHSAKLISELHLLFPALSASVEYEWSATFGESRDGLPFIGRDPLLQNVYYCLGYGGNGTVYSMLGASLLLKLIRGQSDPLCDVVRLDR